MSSKSFGDYVARRRRCLDLTQSQLAKRIGVSRVMLSYYECGHRLPRERRLPAIAKALGVQVGTLSRHAK